MKETIQIEVEKETYELGQAVRKFIGSVRAALKDGWQPGSDIPAIAQAAFLDLVPAVQNAEAASANAKEDSRAFVRALAAAGEDIAFDFLAP